MLDSTVILTADWLAQIINEPVITSAEDAALVFSGPQFFTALIAGVVLAFAFQMLLTNLGVAAGISFAGGGSSSKDYGNNHSSVGGTMRHVSLVLGLGTLVSVTIALFVACLLAIKLSLFVSPLSGAIVGLVIWGTYFSLLVWVSSTTIGSLVGSVVNTATASFQALMGTATAALGAKAASKKAVDTAEATVAAIRRELGDAIDPVTIREDVEDYLASLKPQPLDVDKLASEIETLIDEQDLQDLAESDRLPLLNRQTFVDLLAERSDLSQRDINRIADKLETVWGNITQKLPSRRDSLAELTNYVKSATSEQLLGSEFSQKLERLVEEMRKRRRSEHPGVLKQSLTMGLHGLMGTIMGRTDLSELDIDKIVDQINQVRTRIGEETDKLAHRLGDTQTTNGHHLRTDIEDYLLNAYPWNLRRETIHQEFQDLVYHSPYHPETIAHELENIDRSTFVNVLEDKGILTQQKIQTTADLLEENRLEVINTAYTVAEEEKKLAVLARVKRYLFNTPKEDLLNPEKVQIAFKPVLADRDAEETQLKDRLSQFDIPKFEDLLAERHDIEVGERVFIAPQLETVRQQVLKESQDEQAAIQGRIDQQWLKLQTYLQETGKEQLNPQAIQQELQLLLSDPQMGAKLLRARASRFDRESLVKLLSQRQDLDEAQINEIIDQVEDVWTRVRSVPTKLAGKVEAQYEQVTAAIADYLRKTDKAELNPEGIQRDLTLLVNQPRMGIEAIQERLAMMDRDTLVQLLSQRDDLSEAEVNHIIDEVIATLKRIAKMPQRVAQQTQLKVQQFQAALADYLRSTEREELNPQGIKRDLQLLLNDPRAGIESLQERLAYFDRDTLVALLSQRDDISKEEVNQIIERILEVRDQILRQLEYAQRRLQAAIDRILDKIRHYLNSLERPELEYEGIRDDLHQLLNDPQAGFDALRDRFSHVNRETVIAVLSSRDDISQADAERVVGQVEHTRDRILQRAERIQREAKLRLEEVKFQAQQQAAATKKAASVAAWWLFFTALVSALASAGAGAIAVGI